MNHAFSPDNRSIFQLSVSFTLIVAGIVLFDHRAEAFESLAATDIGAPAGRVFEAEAFDSADSRWALTRATKLISAGVAGDLDTSQSGISSGEAYMRLLPEGRAAAGDAGTAGMFWALPVSGPALLYHIEFPQAGRYQVFVRAYSTGEQDDSIHVGLDGTWYAEGTVIESCGQRGQWVWSTCDDAADVFVNVPSSGLHTVYFTGREVGFELDQFVLSLQDSHAALSGIHEPELGSALGTGNGAAHGIAAIAQSLMLLLFGIGCFRLSRYCKA